MSNFIKHRVISLTTPLHPLQQLFSLDRVFQVFLIFLLSSVLHILLNFLSFFSGKALWPLGAATMQGRRWKGRKPKLQIVNVLKLYIVPLYHCKCIIDTLYHAFEIVIVSI